MEARKGRHRGAPIPGRSRHFLVHQAQPEAATVDQQDVAVVQRASLWFRPIDHLLGAKVFSQEAAYIIDRPTYFFFGVIVKSPMGCGIADVEPYLHKAPLRFGIPSFFPQGNVQRSSLPRVIELFVA